MEGFKVEGIPSQETYDWLLHKHYAHRIPSISYAFGLFDCNILVGVCTFGMPASPSLCSGIMGEDMKSYVIELNRLCIESNQKNVTSWFVSRCLKMIPGPLCIVSYADTAMGHVGKIYQACNFLFTGTTKERTDIFAGEGKHSRHYSGDRAERQFRSSKHRYIYFVGNKKEVKAMRSVLKYPIESYPQGKTKRYDASYQPATQGILF